MNFWVETASKQKFYSRPQMQLVSEYTDWDPFFSKYNVIRKKWNAKPLF